ncbi:MAG: hypothetical protein ABIA63_10245 [bacterium]
MPEYKKEDNGVYIKTDDITDFDSYARKDYGSGVIVHKYSELPVKIKERYDIIYDNPDSLKCEYCKRTGTIILFPKIYLAFRNYALRDNSSEKGYRWIKSFKQGFYYIHLMCEAEHYGRSWENYMMHYDLVKDEIPAEIEPYQKDDCMCEINPRRWAFYGYEKAVSERLEYLKEGASAKILGAGPLLNTPLCEFEYII